MSLYRDVRSWRIENDPDGPGMVEWSSRECGIPMSPEEVAGQVIWIILYAGRKAQAARTIEKKVWTAIHGARPVVEVFGYRAKAEAIERAWRERDEDFAALRAAAAGNDPERLVEWCGSLPFVGDDTKFQLAKNFGADICKPDIWLCRLTGIADRPRRSVKDRFPACMALCSPLSAATSDRIATVDSVLWLACNKGILQVSAQAGAITYRPVVSTGRPIMAVG